MCEIVCNQYCQLARQIADAEWELESLLRRTVLTQPHLHQNALAELERRGDKRAYETLSAIAAATKVEMTPVPIETKGKASANRPDLLFHSSVGEISEELYGLPIRRG